MFLHMLLQQKTEMANMLGHFASAEQVCVNKAEERAEILKKQVLGGVMCVLSQGAISHDSLSELDKVA